MRIPWRTRLDLETVPFGALAVGALHFRLVHASLRDRAFGVVNNNPGWRTAERFEGAAVTAQPGGNGLVAHELGVLVTGPSKGHDKKPGLEDLPGVHVGDGRSGAEVHLRRFRRLEHQPQGHLRRFIDDELMEKAIHRGGAALVAVIARQRRMNGRALDAGCVPIGDLRAPRLQRRYAGAGQGLLALQGRGQNGVLGQIGGGGKPTARVRQFPNLRDLLTSHGLEPGNLPVGVALAHAHKDLSVLIHFELSFGHGSSRKNFRSLADR